MSWTYIPTMDEYDKEVSKDTSTLDRYTFRRYLYFEPSQYENWKKGENYQDIPYTAELVGNPYIPSAGTHLSGSLSAFYVNDVISIMNLSEEEHGDHCSYAQVTLEYENKRQSSGSGGSGGWDGGDSQPVKGLKPWERKVDDFTITNQEVNVPMISGYLKDEHGFHIASPVETTAGQVLYGFTSSIWIQRLTWTFYDQNSDYSLSSAVVNNSQVTLFNKITIPPECGLLLPPSYKKMYFYESEEDTNPTEYDQWNFEIIVNTAQKFSTPILNAGTKFITPSGYFADICSWYVYDPLVDENVYKEYGSFNEMMHAKKQVDEFNKNLADETTKKIWNGDYVQTPVPLTISGEIDYDAIFDPSETIKREYTQYIPGTWNLGIR